ncbi:MAG: tetratricopeptide repeat protein [Bacteroidales bacterium]|nr:tetratricopeptide repeat protein [Bacteroidales bacterium]
MSCTKAGAIKDFEDAVKFAIEHSNFHDTAMAFYNSGNTKREFTDYNGAINDFTQAIRYDPKYAAAYNNRGSIKLDKLDYNGAIEDFTQAIKIDNSHTGAYYNRGNAKLDTSDYEGAIEDYTEAIKILKEKQQVFRDVYKNRGIAFANTKQYEKAELDFLEAKTDILLVCDLGKSGEIVARMLLNNDAFFKEAIDGCKENEIESYKDLYLQSLKIITKLQVYNKEEAPAVTYTSKKVSEYMFFEGSSFQLSLANTSNDPQEGKVLFRYLSVNNDLLKDIDSSNGAFIGCFILNKDSLNQFRLYGKTKNEEGTGVAIAFNGLFFSKHIRSPRSNNILDESYNKVSNNKIETNTNKKNLSNLLPLFRCIYIDPETNRVVSLGHKEEYVFYRESELLGNNYSKYKEKIDKTQKEVDIELKRLREQSNRLDQTIVCKLLLNLRYLIKHVAFKEEQECRIIQIKKYSDEEIKIEEIKNDENNVIAKRKYVEYLKANPYNVDVICLGPKIEDEEIQKVDGWGINIEEYKHDLDSKGYKYEISTSPLDWSQNKKNK